MIAKRGRAMAVGLAVVTLDAVSAVIIITIDPEIIECFPQE